MVGSLVSAFLIHFIFLFFFFLMHMTSLKQVFNTPNYTNNNLYLLVRKMKLCIYIKEKLI